MKSATVANLAPPEPASSTDAVAGTTVATIDLFAVGYHLWILVGFVA